MPSRHDLERYYAQLPEEGGFDSYCYMEVPAYLEGKVVLDVCCRRGKGVYKFSDMVGAHGLAIGVDWRPAFIERARAGVPHAMERNSLGTSNMRFAVAYPEDLSAAGIAQGSCDFAYINGVLNLLYAPAQTLAQIARVLKPGGALLCQTVLAGAPRNPCVVAQARALGNVVQSAPARSTFEGWLVEAGFDLATCEIAGEQPVLATAAVDAETEAPVVETGEQAAFAAVNVTIETLPAKA